ncbi:protein YgfX [uncultured Shewanella sp.]|uniref:protein YgfX n=1 Tax=uncultured Shewanella sp. TaxID=173975 RepID=UPI00262B859E|nr:protein YgfX [uncultured Shewanella sp.]
MVEQHLSFSLVSSFDQRLTLVIFYLILLASFLFWPQTELVIFLTVKLLLFIALSILFVWQGWKLKCWQYQFSLTASGTGHFSNGRQFNLVKRPLISAFAVVFYYQYPDEKKIGAMMIWSDMLTDTDYRHLCRLLCQNR